MSTAQERLAARRAQYDSPEHRDGRARALAVATPLTKCARCRLPLGRDLVDASDSIHYDHTDERDGYLGLSHGRCDSRAGGKAAARARRQQVQAAAGGGGYVPVWEW